MPRTVLSVLCLIALLLAPAFASADTLTGRVLDADGRPAADAQVLITAGGAIVTSVRAVATDYSISRLDQV